MSATWNGTTISGPVLIYQDELVPDGRALDATPIDGTLICRSEDYAYPGWYVPTGGLLFYLYHEDFTETRSGNRVPGVSRMSVHSNDIISTGMSGLWTCRGRPTDGPAPIPVGIYARAEGKKLQRVYLFYHGQLGQIPDYYNITSQATIIY